MRLHNAQEEDIYEHAVDWRAEVQTPEENKPGSVRKHDAVAPIAASRTTVIAPSQLSWRWRTRAGALVVLVSAGGLATWSLLRGGAIPYITPQKVERGSVIRTVSATGVVNTVSTAPVRPHVSGVIQALHCGVNTEVKAGQLCTKIDPSPYQAAVDQERAYLAEAAARLESDKADLAHAKAAFERNQIRARHRAVSRGALNAAPISQSVAACSEGPPLFLVATDLTVVQVDAKVSANDIGKVRLGDKASFTVESIPNRAFDGEVIQIRQSMQANVTTCDVVISAPNPDLLFKSGMRTTVQIVVGRRDNVL